MATFQAQVTGLTNLVINDSSGTPSTTELTTFLEDGLMDVTNRWLDIHPEDFTQFTRVSGEVTSNGAEKVDRAKIVSVVRESGTNNDWRSCTYTTPEMQSRVTDVDSIHYASKLHPVYTVLEDGSINVFPAPGSDPNAFKVYYINNNGRDTSDNSLTYASSGIAFFPKDKVRLVVIYAAIKTLEAKMAFFSTDEEDLELVQAIQANIIALQNQYDKAFMPNPQAGQQGAE
jgi:hypothetical protein